jgi:hypothetical protein
MQRQDELGPEAGGKTRDPNFEIRNKSECQKFKCSKRCRKSSRLTGILEDKLFLVILILNLFRVSDFVLRIVGPGLPLG